MTWTTANLLSLFRILLIPVILYLINIRNYQFALFVFFIVAITDVLDGYIARRWKQRTILGSYLDPIADKLLLVSVLVLLALIGEIPLWLVIWAVIRDFIILSSSLFIRFTVGAINFPPTVYGKLTTFFQLALVVAVMLVRAYRLHASWLIDSMVWITLFFTFYSGFHYIYHASRIVMESKDSESTM